MVDLSKRYWLISFDDYYPSGGLDDVVLTDDSIDDLRTRAYYSSCIEIIDSSWRQIKVTRDNSYIYDKINNERIEYQITEQT